MAEIVYGTWSAHITYSDPDGNEMFRHFATHGRNGISSTLTDPARRRSALENRLRTVLRNKFGDCALMTRGHTHKIISAEPVRDLYLYQDNSFGIEQGYKKSEGLYIPPSLRWYASTGSFFRLYGHDGTTSYAEEADYDPIEIGFCIARVRDGRLVGIDEVII